jgi:hypothetical protein
MNGQVKLIIRQIVSKINFFIEGGGFDLLPWLKGRGFNESIIHCIYLVNFPKDFLDFIYIDVIKNLSSVRH